MLNVSWRLQCCYQPAAAAESRHARSSMIDLPAKELVGTKSPTNTMHLNLLLHSLVSQPQASSTHLPAKIIREVCNSLKKSMLPVFPVSGPSAWLKLAPRCSPMGGRSGCFASRSCGYNTPKDARDHGIWPATLDCCQPQRFRPLASMEISSEVRSSAPRQLDWQLEVRHLL